MIIGLLLIILASFTAAELLSLSRRLCRLRLEHEIDLTLAAPDEVITLRYELRNLSPLPRLSVGLSIYLPDGAELREDPEWIARFGEKSSAGVSVHRRCALMGHTKITGQVRFSLTQRGLYSVGKYYTEAGDLLGLRSQVFSGPLEKRIVCTSRLCEEAPELQTLGGLLGEVSVRRFLHPDPTLIVGFRDYTGREPMKQISWTATARVGRLMVRELDYTVDTNVTLVVNLRGEKRELLERCLMLVRTVCEELELRQIPYALRTNGDLADLDEGLGKAHVFAVLRRIGLSRLGSYENLASLAARCAAERRAGASYLLICPCPGPEVDDAVRLLQRYSEGRVEAICAEGGERA